MTQEVMTEEVQLSNVYKQSCQKHVGCFCFAILPFVVFWSLDTFPWNVNQRPATCSDFAIFLIIVIQRELDDAKIWKILHFLLDLVRKITYLMMKILGVVINVHLLTHHVFRLFLQFSANEQRTSSSAQGWYCKQGWYKTQYHVALYHVLFNMIQT